MQHHLDPDIAVLRQRFAQARPKDGELVIYRLDWVTPLAAAQKQAITQRRPLCVVAVRNEHGDTFTGHC